MASWNIEKAGKKVISLLNQNGANLENHVKMQLKDLGYAKIGGYSCLISNVISSSFFRVRVNKNWFKVTNSEHLKPTMSNTKEKFDFQLFPTNKVLYALYYRALRDYALQLEIDKDVWFKKPRWGMDVNEEEGIFIWKGGNTHKFPLTPIQCVQAFSIREKQYILQMNMG